MHPNEVDTSPGIVRQLVDAQFPQWAQLPLRRIQSTGTDNVIYRLGEQYAVRLPRIHWALNQIDKEFAWLPKLAPRLPLQVPVPLKIGQPDDSYPYQWAIYHWLDGDNSAEAPLTNLVQAAITLANFLKALRQIDTAGGPPAAEANQRGLSLTLRDQATRTAIDQLAGMFDHSRLLSIWEAALEVGDSAEPPVWFHGDLLSGNVLVRDGRLSAVIDFGGLAVGNPTCDLMIAWSLFRSNSRAAFFDALEVDEATQTRSKGHSLSQAALFIPYYLNTNPRGVRYAKTMIKQLLVG